MMHGFRQLVEELPQTEKSFKCRASKSSGDYNVHEQIGLYNWLFKILEVAPNHYISRSQGKHR